jgi:hypothetical protein
VVDQLDQLVLVVEVLVVKDHQHKLLQELLTLVVAEVEQE